MDPKKLMPEPPTYFREFVTPDSLAPPDIKCLENQNQHYGFFSIALNLDFSNPTLSQQGLKEHFDFSTSKDMRLLLKLQL